MPRQPNRCHHPWEGIGPWRSYLKVHGEALLDEPTPLMLVRKIRWLFDNDGDNIRATCVEKSCRLPRALNACGAVGCGASR